MPPCDHRRGRRLAAALIDHHVHLHLIDERLLCVTRHRGRRSTSAAIRSPSLAAPPEGMPRVAYAGAFLTAPGGYPVGRSWAPPAIGPRGERSLDPSRGPGRRRDRGRRAGVVRSIRHQGRAERRGRAGPRCRHAGGDRRRGAARTHCPSWRTSRAPGWRARHRRGRRCPGPHAVQRADRSRRSSRTRSASGSCGSRRSTSIAMIPRAAASPARISSASSRGRPCLYGTDLGNGDLPVGVNARELDGPPRGGTPRRRAAGRPHRPLAARRSVRGVATFVAGDPPADLDAVPAWLAARPSSPPRS